ncbi:MAG TPA: hypothetical protein VMW56_09135 [Candidatus Margulisiibacteriota bacterium]|nr:hypothetical protein [Candidatus Margulisiibacteriota bacterium]
MAQRTLDGLEPSKALFPELALLLPKAANLFPDILQDSYGQIGRFRDNDD